MYKLVYEGFANDLMAHDHRDNMWIASSSPDTRFDFLEQLSLMAREILGEHGCKSGIFSESLLCHRRMLGSMVALTQRKEYLDRDISIIISTIIDLDR